MTACTGTPISWLRLEAYALDGRDAAITDHLAACPACTACLAQIRGDELALPRLVVPAPTPARGEGARRWWRWAVPAMAVAAAALVLVIVRPREDTRREDTARVKGVGDVVFGVVRERAGAIRDDVRTFAPGDRWKVVVTCPPAASAWLDVAVVDAGQVDYPLAPVRVRCGNSVAVPGAFAITGSRPNRVCVRVAADGPPPRAVPRADEAEVACLTLRPE